MSMMTGATARRGMMPLVLCGLFVACGGCESLDNPLTSALKSRIGQGAGSELSLETLVAGLKEALQVGTANTVLRTGREGGYLNDAKIRIPMPERLEGMASALRKIGMGSQVDAFETRMNRAAELAALAAKPVFLEAIRTMSFEDARKILAGGDTAATDFFRLKTAADLQARYQPIIAQQMQELNAIGLYKELEGRYNKLPFVPKVDYQIESYVTEQALTGLFTVLASEEREIRRNPAARTTQLLQQVFGQ